MTEKERNDYFYVCALIEYISRETLNQSWGYCECDWQKRCGEAFA